MEKKIISPVIINGRAKVYTDNEEQLNIIVHLYLHEVLPVIEKMYYAIAHHEYTLLPCLSHKLIPYFDKMELSKEILFQIDTPENDIVDFRQYQRLYMKLKSVCESSFDNIRTKLVQKDTLKASYKPKVAAA